MRPSLPATLPVTITFLNEFSPNISYKPDPCRPIKGQITPEEWLAFSKYNITETPWVLFIGPKAAGKTTFLANANVNFILKKQLKILK